MVSSARAEWYAQSWLPRCHALDRKIVRRVG
jgi:hypothetical protein